jgi:hypothetical protein
VKNADVGVYQNMTSIFFGLEAAGYVGVQWGFTVIFSLEILEKN